MPETGWKPGTKWLGCQSLNPATAEPAMSPPGGPGAQKKLAARNALGRIGLR